MQAKWLEWSEVTMELALMDWNLRDALVALTGYRLYYWLQKSSVTVWLQYLQNKVHCLHLGFPNHATA